MAAVNFNPFVAGVAFEYSSEMPKIVAVHKVVPFSSGNPETDLCKNPVPAEDNLFYSLFSTVFPNIIQAIKIVKLEFLLLEKRLTSKVLKNDATVIVIDDDDDDNDDSIQIKSESTAEPVLSIEPVLLNPEVTLEIDTTELPLPDVMEVLQDVDGNSKEVEFYDQSANPSFMRQNYIVQPMDVQPMEQLPVEPAEKNIKKLKMLLQLKVLK